MELVVSLEAVKQLRAIPAVDAKRLVAALKDIAAAHPQRLPFVTEMAGGSGDWRVRKGDYRAIYRVEGNLMTVISAEHRREIYR